MKAHIVSHSHLDREWYETFEQHRMKVVELIDDLIELFENDSEFKAFHLDGQVILLDDYLQIKPQNKEKIKKLIDEKKLIIGPYYILQDELLLTGEENVRNSLVGKSYEKIWGSNLCKIGYFPDTFGHIGQLAQLCFKSGHKYAFFGRGVNPIGFDNEVLEDENFSSSYSEMWLEAPDGSRVLGILFANWYCNGNEIPVDKVAAKNYWYKRIQAAKKYASTDSLLFMNGCDHQPVQKNLSEAIRVANELYLDIQFIHSTLEDYAKEVEKQIPDDLAVIKGEMTSQETDGFYTLANTASSRIYLKQHNAIISDKLTMTLEPLLAMTNNSLKYKGQLDYATKLLLQNLPHDSICGCSIDEVHKEMEVRFDKCEKVIDYVTNDVFDEVKKIKKEDVVDGLIPFVVVNPSPNKKEEMIQGVYDLNKNYFEDFEMTPTKLYRQVQNKEHKKYDLYDIDGNIVSSNVYFEEVKFGYELPKRTFRKPFIAESYRVKFLAKLEPMSVNLFYFKQRKNDMSIINKSLNFENDYYKLELKNKNINYVCKENKLAIDNLFEFVDSGDIGNEYIYKSPKKDKEIVSKLLCSKCKYADERSESWLLKYVLNIPSSADDTLLMEEKALVEFRERNADRSDDITELIVEVTLDLFYNSSGIRLSLDFENKQKNHRLAIRFNTGFKGLNTHFSDSSFEIVKRPNSVSKNWKNETNPQHMLKLVGFENGVDEQKSGILISSSGINEYEVKKIDDKDCVQLTLLRSVDELGDWGYFKTYDSLCLRKFRFDIIINSFNKQTKNDVIKLALMSGVKSVADVGEICDETCKMKEFDLPQDDRVFYTALKKHNEKDCNVVRYVNLTEENIDFSVNKNAKYLNLLEEDMIEQRDLKGYSIKTEIL